jgi:Zn-dependent M28 family amino/carboxypeptidase
MLLAAALAGSVGERWPAVAKLHRRAVTPLGVASLLLLPSVAWHSGRVSPGAGDNLSGVAVMHAFAGELAAARDARSAPQYAYLQPLLSSTEIVLLATSSEEAGLRGAKRYAAMHAAEHAALPTAVVCLEALYNASHLSVITSEPSPGVVHDAALVALALSASHAAILPTVRAVQLPIGGTDAAAFTRAGVAAVALTAVDLATMPPEYHTRLDMLSAVQPEALDAQLRLLAQLAAAVGRGDWEVARRGAHGRAAELRDVIQPRGGGGEL